MVIELLRNAITGVNIIPTVLLGLVLLYWISVIVGALDMDFLDFDLDGLEQSDILSGLFVFLNVAQLPFMLFFSIIILNFWILSMLVHYFPINPGSVINGLFLIPLFVLSLFLTKYETIPLKGIFTASDKQDDKITPIVHHLCKLRSELSGRRLGQGEVEREGRTIIIHVKPDSPEDVFEKGEIAFVGSKDINTNIYYIIKLRGVEK